MQEVLEIAHSLGLPDLTPCLILGGVLLVLVLWKPVTLLVKLGVRTAAGLAVLTVVSPLAGLIGVELGVNLFNAAVLGILGAPGLGVLVMLELWSRS